jgi:FlaA1/EpsC-like NDP-sugar epimerase
VSTRAIVIGLPESCRRLERQLALLPAPPAVVGWIVPPPADRASAASVLGTLDDLEAVLGRERPDVALVALPAAMGEMVTTVRTRLRRAGLPERFMPTLEDQLAGVGPRSRFEIDLAELLDRPRRAIDERVVRGAIEGKRVLITGAGGSIGGELARIVSGYGIGELILVERAENALFEIDRQIARRAPELTRRAVLHDMVDAEGTMKVFDRLEPDIVLHSAAHKHVPMMEDHPAAAVDNNLFGTISVLDAADAVGVERFVMISTDKAVNPRSVMGATKRLAELYVQDRARRTATGCAMVRFGNVLGSSGSVLDIWSREVADGGPLTVTDPRMTRYFMTVAEAALLVIQSVAFVQPEAREAAMFLLDMGEPVRVLDLAKRFCTLHGLDSETMRLVFTGARPGEKLHEELAYGSEALEPTGHPEIHRLRLVAPKPEFVRKMTRALAPGRRDPEAAEVARVVLDLARPRRAESSAA